MSLLKRATQLLGRHPKEAAEATARFAGRTVRGTLKTAYSVLRYGEKKARRYTKRGLLRTPRRLAIRVGGKKQRGRAIGYFGPKAAAAYGVYRLARRKSNPHEDPNSVV